MINVILEVACMFFAVYGVLMLAIGIIDFVCYKSRPKGAVVQPVLVVKNCEDIIEGVIRNITISNFMSKLMSDSRLIVIDNGSTDNTVIILERLQTDYTFLEILKTEQIGDIFCCEE